MKIQRSAEWIWIQNSVKKQEQLFSSQKRDASDFMNCFVYFRREFELDSSFQCSPFYISADGRYQLFINGQFAGRGPARCHPQNQYHDSYNINRFLRQGKNLIAVLVHTYGRNMSWYEMPDGIQFDTMGCGGLFCQCRVDSGSKTLILDTGKNWKYKQSDAWEKDVPCGSTGYAEYFDFRKEPQGWNTVEFNEQGWKPPEILKIPFPLGGSDVVPFPCMTERDIPFLRETLVYPQALLKSEGFTELLSVEAAVSVDESSTAELLYDFGKVVIGRVTLEIDALESGCIVEIAYSERLTEDGYLLIPPEVPGISAVQKHYITLRAGFQHFAMFESAGFRYLRLKVIQCRKKLVFRKIAVLSCGYSLEHQGDFECSDSMLNRIWKAGAYTVGLCSQDGFLDCPTREQRQWIGDVFVQAMVHFITEQDTGLVRQYLRQVAETQRPDGMVMMATTCDLNAAKKNFITDFSLLWILTAEKYLQHTGDIESIKTVFPSMVKLEKWFRFYLNSDHLLCDLPGWTFIDWSVELGKEGEVTVLNALYFGALKALASFSRLLKFDSAAEEYKELAGRTEKAINNTFWDEGKGCYVDNCVNGTRGTVISQHANAIVIYFNIAPRERWTRIFETILDEKRVTLTQTWRWDKQRPFNPSKDIVMVQPFFSVFLHGALQKAGMIEAFIQNVRNKWGPMADAGSTLWESWQLTDITSTCHGFSASPTYFLSTVILGISVSENGFQRICVKVPDCSVSWARGSVPSPLGPVSVSWKNTGTEIVLMLNVPEGMEGHVILPDGFIPKQPLCFGPGTHELSAALKEMAQ